MHSLSRRRAFTVTASGVEMNRGAGKMRTQTNFAFFSFKADAVSSLTERYFSRGGFEAERDGD